MKTYRLSIILMLASLSLFSQKWVSPNFDNHRLDYRDLGYPGVTEIPADDSRISALITGQNTYVYGATSGKQSYLFLYDRYINKVRPLGKIEKETGVHHAIVEDNDGNIYIGTGLNLLDEIPLTRDFPGGHRAIETQLWKDIKKYHDGYDGGKILKFDAGKYSEKVYLPDDKADVEQIGKVLENNSVYTLTIDKSKNILYGITYPDAHFFRLVLANNHLKDYGEIFDTLVYAGPERSWRSVPRDLLVLEDGRVLTAAKDGLITIFDPEKEVFEYTTLRIPGEYFESWNYIGFPVVEQLIQDKIGMIWGSTSDGFLFKLNLEQMSIIDLGKARLARRIRAMTIGNDNNLYFIAGELGEPCKLFSYNTVENNGFKNWSYISVDHSPYYAKRAYQFEAIITGVDGTIFIGESDRRGKLFLFIPGGDIIKGGLNSKNPR